MLGLLSWIVVPLAFGAVGLAFAQDVDLSIVHRIKDQAFNHSRVMDYVFDLTDRNGSRITGSPGHHRAADAVVAAMQAAGIADAAAEPWEDFGRGWSYSRVSVQMLEPQQTTLTGIPMAWSDGTPGPVQAEVISAPLFGDDSTVNRFDLEQYARHIAAYRERYAGRLGGKIVLAEPAHEFVPGDEAPFQRLDGDELQEVSEAEVPEPREPLTWPVWQLPSDGDARSAEYQRMPPVAQIDYWERQMAIDAAWHAFLRDEGVLAVLVADSHDEGGTIFADRYGSWVPGAAVAVPTVSLSPEHYNRILRLLENDVPVTIEIDVAAQFHDESTDGRNVVFSLPGTSRREEIVMLGGHLDSWHGATGASDNAAGCAIVMEVMRILSGLGVEMDRTVRAALWDGEEQGYYGSLAYVRSHFADPVTLERLPAHARLSAYFNLDNGGGKIRGVYLQGNDMARPIFDAWLAPFADLGAATVSIRSSFFTDHHVFDSVGLPGFQFIQDPLEYRSRTHHSNLDTSDHLQATDLMQAAAVMASVVYHAATMDGLMPRKPLPPPLPERQPVPELIRYASPGAVDF
jgi:hypothetical protein